MWTNTTNTLYSTRERTSCVEKTKSVSVQQKPSMRSREEYTFEVGLHTCCNDRATKVKNVPGMHTAEQKDTPCGVRTYCTALPMYLKFDILVLQGLDVEADGGDGLDVIVRFVLQAVQDGSLPRVV